MDAKTVFSSSKHDWATPNYIFEKYDKLYNFNIDLAANSSNAKVRFFYDEESDSLSCSWDNIRGWLNPPYGRGIIDWVKKAYNSINSIIVMLVPARVDTKWWGVFWDYELHRPKPGIEVHFIPGRIKFVGAESSAPFPSAIIIFDNLIKD